MPTIDEVQDIEPIIRYNGTNGVDTYVYPFPIFDERDIIVDISDVVLTLNVDYTVTGVTASNGGTIVLTNPTAGGEAIVLYRDTPVDRLTDYVENGDFLADTVNNDFDRIILMLQELKDGPNGVSRAVRAGIDDATPSEDLIIDDVATRAGKALGFDFAGKVISVMLEGGLDLLKLSTIKLTALGAVDNSAIDVILAQAVTSFSSISFDGLTNVWLDNPLTVPDNCHEWLLYGCTLTLNAERLVFDAQSMDIDLGGGKILGALKVARLTADAAQNSTVLTVDDSSEFTPTAIAQPITNPWSETNYLSTGADNTNMPNADSRATSNGGYNLVRSSTPTTLTVDIQILQGAANPLRSGTYVGNWSFNTVGITFNGLEQATIKNGTLGRFRGYMTSFEKSFNDGGEKLGNFTLENIKLVKTGLDCFRFSGHTFLLDRVSLESGEQLDLFKQLIVSTWNVDGAIIFRNCDIKRNDHDADIMVFDTLDGVSPTQNGSVLFDNSVMDGSWNGNYTSGTKNGRISSTSPVDIGEPWQLHTVVPFNQDNTFRDLLATGTCFKGVSRAVFGTTFVAKDVYEYQNCSFRDCIVDADVIYVDITSLGNLDVYNKYSCQVENSTVIGRAYLLNFAVNTVYTDCHLICPQSSVDNFGFIQVSYSRMVGGRLEGRFKILGSRVQMNNVTLPKTDGESYIPLIGDNYFGTSEDTFILEGFNKKDAGFIDISQWIVPNSGAQPALPAFNMLNELNGAVMQWGNDFAASPFYKVELLAQNEVTPPESTGGRFFQKVPNNSVIFNTTEKTKKFLTTTGSGNPIKSNVLATSTQITIDKQFSVDIAPTGGDMVALINIEDSVGTPNPDNPSTHYYYIASVVESGIEITMTLDRPIGFEIKMDDPDWTDNGYELVYVYHVWGLDLAAVPFDLLNPVANDLDPFQFEDVMNFRLLTFNDGATGNIKFDDGFPQGFICDIVNLGAGGCSIGTTGGDQMSGNLTPASNEIVQVRKVDKRQWIAGNVGAPLTGITTPDILTPTEGNTITSPTAPATSSIFSATGGITHASSNWQVSLDYTFNQVIFESLADGVNLTSITMENLPEDTTVYIRVEYVGNGGELSGYSVIRTATTLASGGTDLLVGQAASYVAATNTGTLNLAEFYISTDKLLAFAGMAAGTNKLSRSVNQDDFTLVNNPLNTTYSTSGLDGADDKSVIYMSGASGVFRTVNPTAGTITWTETTGIDYFGFTDIGTEMSCDATGVTVLIGLGKRNSDNTVANDIYISTNSGVSAVLTSTPATGLGGFECSHVAKGDPTYMFLGTEGSESREGTIFRSGDTGASFLKIDLPNFLTSQKVFDIDSTPDGSIVYAACSAGRIYKSEDFGVSFTEILIGVVTESVRSCTVSRDGMMIAFGVQGGQYLRSFDGGINFELANPQISNDKILAMNVNSAGDLMYVGSTNGTILKSEL